MKDSFGIYKEDIQTIVDQSCVDFAKDFSFVNVWSTDVSERLQAFLRGGKMVRGSLVAFTSELFGCAANSDTYRIAAAMEIFHASLLIHDDIMDDDKKRRGKDAMHFQYQKLAEEK